MLVFFEAEVNVQTETRLVEENLELDPPLEGTRINLETEPLIFYRNYGATPCNSEIESHQHVKFDYYYLLEGPAYSPSFVEQLSV